MTPQQANELLGYLNVKYGTFFRPAELAATERTRELIESGEIIEVRRAPAPTSEPGARECGAAVGWNDALVEVRAAVCEMQNNLEAFGEYSQETARCVLDGVLDSIDEIMAEPIEIPAPPDYALVPVRVTQAMRAAWDATPSNEDDDVEFAHAYQRMMAASVPPTIPRWDQLIDWESDRKTAILMVEGLKSENALLRAALATPASPAVPAGPLAPSERLAQFLRCAYPVAQAINPRGYNWCEAWLDEARTAALADPAPLVAQASPTVPAAPMIASKLSQSTAADGNWMGVDAPPAPEASPLVEDAQRIVAGKVEAEWPKMNPACRC